jgi:hypothetical protein
MFKLSFSLAVAGALLALGLPSAARANDPGGGGSPVCSNYGRTVPWSGYQQVYTPAYQRDGQRCLSKQTEFEAYLPNVGSDCVYQFAGYEAEVYWLRSDSDWVSRFHDYFCADGFSHYSAAWDYNEWRVSVMTIDASDMDWIMNEYAW